MSTMVVGIILHRCIFFAVVVLASLLAMYVAAWLSRKAKALSLWKQPRPVLATSSTFRLRTTPHISRSICME